MAHIKAGGVTKGNRDSQAKRLGVKASGGSRVINGNIIIRQKGTKYHPGKGVLMGKDFTIFAHQDGIVKFSRKESKLFVNVV